MSHLPRSRPCRGLDRFPGTPSLPQESEESDIRGQNRRELFTVARDLPSSRNGGRLTDSGESCHGLSRPSSFHIQPKS
jgi:hypothetical protein